MGNLRDYAECARRLTHEHTDATPEREQGIVNWIRRIAERAPQTVPPPSIRADSEDLLVLAWYTGIGSVSLSFAACDDGGIETYLGRLLDRRSSGVENPDIDSVIASLCGLFS